ncbi:hypothetical protein SA32RD_50 [Escherichia phage vB_EcoS_SA32RD]|nr:hypothetical protein SA32RD_50 [Escherichia phage vB_EcoS_SA32RD]
MARRITKDLKVLNKENVVKILVIWGAQRRVSKA